MWQAHKGSLVRLGPLTKKSEKTTGSRGKLLGRHSTADRDGQRCSEHVCKSSSTTPARVMSNQYFSQWYFCQHGGSDFRTCTLAGLCCGFRPLARTGVAREMHL